MGTLQEACVNNASFDQSAGQQQENGPLADAADSLVGVPQIILQVQALKSTCRGYVSRANIAKKLRYSGYTYLCIESGLVGAHCTQLLWHRVACQPAKPATHVQVAASNAQRELLIEQRPSCTCLSQLSLLVSVYQRQSGSKLLISYYISCHDLWPMRCARTRRRILAQQISWH